MRRKKSRRTRYISGPERRLLKFLQEQFVSVTDQIKCHDQRIDMYIKDCDVYVQLDGMYWHGLDETLERPNAIIRKMRKDMLLNGMFRGAKSGSRLFRITDRQWEHMEATNSREILPDIIRNSPFGLTEYDGLPGFRKGKN